MELTDVLISTRGPFCLSDRFKTEYFESTGRHVNISNRTDKYLIEMFKNMGSDSSTSNLITVKVPALFKNFVIITEFPQYETIHIDKDKAFAKLLHDFMNGEFDLNMLKTRYNEMVHYSVNRMVYYNTS